MITRIKLFFCLSPVPSKSECFLVKIKPAYLSIWTNPPLELESSTIPITYLIDKMVILLSQSQTADWNGESFKEQDELL
jgi:hypothetical protein